MSIRLGVLLSLAVSACATAPVKDDDAERVEKSMAPETKPEPGGVAFDSKSAPPLATAPYGSPSVGSTPRGRLYRRSTPMTSDMSRAMQPGAPADVTVPSVGTTPTF